MLVSDRESKTWAVALLIATCGVTTALAVDAAADVPPTTVAIVNGEAITVEDLERRLESLHGEVGATRRSAASIERLLDKVVNDVLIGQEARFLGLQEEPPIPETIERNRQNLALTAPEREEIRKP